jgi:hydrogenase maturation factor
MIGYDSGMHQVDGKYLVVASDPCTGVPEEWFGYLLINYAASDLALSGAKPQFCTINLLAPLGTKLEVFQFVMKQICQAAEALGIAIVRGHTGMYGSVSELVGVATVYGSVQLEKLITPANAKPGDIVMCTKPLGLETLTNFALTHSQQAQKLFGVKQQQQLSSQVHLQSCVEEALQLAAVGGVHAMHDATEGGFVAALNELAGASNVGFKVDWGRIPVSKEAYALQKHFKLSDEQLLAMSSTGTILAAVDPAAKEKVEATLAAKGLRACFLGEFTGDKVRLLIKNGKESLYPQVADDPYALILNE